MKIIRDLSQSHSNRKLVLTIGNFDGLHLGHQKIMQQVLRDAKKYCAASCVLTFAVHPRKVIFQNKKLRLLNFLSHKLTHLMNMNIEVVCLVPFNKRIRELSKEAFLRRFLLPEKIAKVIVGYDFHFGKNREGTVQDVRAYCKENQIRFQLVRPKSVAGKTVSSSRVRELIKKGDLKGCEKNLGRSYAVIGEVVQGSGVGRRIGVKTANVKVENEIFPPEGVYAVTVSRLKKAAVHGEVVFKSKSKKQYRGLAYRGPLPKFNQRKNDSILEVFLYQFDQNIYHEILEVTFREFIRKPKKVNNLEELEELLLKDIQNYAKKMKGV